jgi:hypothetical protein
MPSCHCQGWSSNCPWLNPQAQREPLVADQIRYVQPIAVATPPGRGVHIHPSSGLPERRSS